MTTEVQLHSGSQHLGISIHRILRTSSVTWPISPIRRRRRYEQVFGCDYSDRLPGSRLAGSNGVFCVFYDLDQHGIVYHNQEFVFRPPEKKP
jgi:hypothetical protein